MKVGDLITPQGNNIFVVFQKKWIMSRSADSHMGAPPSADFYPQNNNAHRIAKVIGENEIFFQGLKLTVHSGEEFKVEVLNESR
tara:strand:+ start:248 stop:499 length:252 start_codon:yes stop_codon:yes gene_type:complete